MSQTPSQRFKKLSTSKRTSLIPQICENSPLKMKIGTWLKLTCLNDILANSKPMPKTSRKILRKSRKCWKWKRRFRKQNGSTIRYVLSDCWNHTMKDNANSVSEESWIASIKNISISCTFSTTEKRYCLTSSTWKFCGKFRNLMRNGIPLEKSRKNASTF